jgi:hypothetical protein
MWSLGSTGRDEVMEPGLPRPDLQSTLMMEAPGSYEAVIIIDKTI